MANPKPRLPRRDVRGAPRVDEMRARALLQSQENKAKGVSSPTTPPRAVDVIAAIGQLKSKKK